MSWIKRHRLRTLLMSVLLLGMGWTAGQAYAIINKSENARFLDDKLPTHNQRYYTFLKALDLMTERQAKVLVETGTARGGKKRMVGDGGSTIIFSEWAQDHDAMLYSVDISAEAIKNAADGLTTSRDSVKFFEQDSVQFLANFNQPIDFLYLDSFDYDKHNPAPSQEHHLKEVMAAFPWLHKGSIILIDDCKQPGGGKGKLVIEYLLAKGWKIHKQGYQVLLLKG